MSRRAQPLAPLPELTSRNAQASCPGGTLAIHRRDAPGPIGVIGEDEPQKRWKPSPITRRQGWCGDGWMG